MYCVGQKGGGKRSGKPKSTQKIYSLEDTTWYPVYWYPVRFNSIERNILAIHCSRNGCISPTGRSFPSGCIPSQVSACRNGSSIRRRYGQEQSVSFFLFVAQNETRIHNHPTCRCSGHTAKPPTTENRCTAGSSRRWQRRRRRRRITRLTGPRTTTPRRPPPAREGGPSHLPPPPPRRPTTLTTRSFGSTPPTMARRRRG